MKKQIKKLVCLKKWLIVIIIFILGYLFSINSISFRQFRLESYLNNLSQGNDIESRPHFVVLKNSGYLVQKKGCHIPAMDPHDSAIKKYIEIAKPIKCNNENYLSLIESNNTAIFINNKSKERFYNETEFADCCWQTFWRTENEDNSYTHELECHKFQDSVNITEEFIKVKCSKNNKTIYRDYHAFLPKKPNIMERIEKRKKSHSELLSLLIIGIDSVSRLNFHRMMPKTVKTLQNLNALEMFGYNKVGENTYPNVIPTLTGYSSEEIEKICWKNKKTPFDKCPFIWKNFSSSGYLTIFGEDACDISTFNYLKPGFRQQPTDYYLRPFCLAAEKEIGNHHKVNTNLCLGGRKNFQVLLNYSFKTAMEFKDKPYFAFFWQTSLTHDYLEYAQLGDNSYNEFIMNLEKNKLLNKTALIFMSDHGLRWGSFRQTYQGRVEDSLPFVFIVLPNWWKEKYSIAWINLKRNTKSLTTAYDLHETLMDLLNNEELNEKLIRERGKKIFKNIKRGISWFLPIPDYRTCSMAEIPEHWCMCHGNKNVSLIDSNVMNSGKFIVNELNRMLDKFPQCANLTLKRLIDATMLMEKEKIGSKIKKSETSAPWFDFTITLETIPGNGIFEGSVRYRNDSKKMELTGTISRLNAYGKQSACIDDFNMRLYCYCI
ncbi:uncharacterized protein LOC127285172 [Leptopilina boulardi]|uniref:uncharacterized protein LOC127285172 n=1 Tax=Leptopilina boulardi TaxID=63433 RepID=UPI0021F5FB2E|nr:uncharacterized protein LOC127285172 [Leptopilina boulardi]XP_051166994.1 uncharacterized protein LOC127285172 [Leptopilina boulardi]XP_051166995.1 uncharacterized protein LOC127285172 [Leptopilina boulardi]